MEHLLQKFVIIQASFGQKKSELDENADLILKIEHLYQQCYDNPNAKTVEQKMMKTRRSQISTNKNGWYKDTLILIVEDA